nr:D-alanyl-D-alanine carboxypeptidase/D-alanyl-D-alanine-endopeptidase [Bifidobacterium gallicum]
MTAHLRHRRMALVILSALVTLGLCVGYVIGDVSDVLPGPLTVNVAQQPEYEKVAYSIGAAEIIKNADTTKPVDAQRAQALVDELMGANGLGRDTSVAVAQADGTIVGAHEPDTVREPASTLKTVTALAAASKLNMGSTLATQVFLHQNDSDQRIVLKGNGDMLLGAGQSDPNHINGRAGLGTLARQTAVALKSRGISAVTLDYDDSLFGKDRYPANLDMSGEMQLYYTAVSSMAVDGGRQRAGALANPDVFHDYPQLSQHPAADAVATFRTALNAQGISVKNGNETTETGTQPIAQVESAPLSAVMMFMLRHSDNTLAEEFGRLLALHEHAPNTPDGARSTVQSVVASLGVPTDGLIMADCSGLSPGSRVSVRTLVTVQARNLQVGGAVAAAEGLAVAGLNGTVTLRLADTKAAGLMRLKTGSLGTVTSLTGNISREQGGVVAFSVVVNNPQDMDAAKEAVDRFAASLARL